MAILTDFMERKLLDHIFGVTEMTKLTSLYLGISTTAFSESDTASQALAKEPGTSGTNYNNNGYSRVNVYSNFEDTTDGATNASAINFSQATSSNWGNIAYWALFEDPLPSNGTSSSTIDADDGQKPLMIGSFSAAVTTNIGDQFRIATGDFDITQPNALNTNTFNGFNNGKFNFTNLMGLNGGFATWTFWDGSDVNEQFYMGVSTSAFGGSGSGNNEDTAGSQEPGYVSGNDSSRSSYVNNGYSYRPRIQFNSASTSSGTTTITNSSAVEFPECSINNWGNITHFAIFAGGDTDATAITYNRYAKYPAGSAVSLGTGSSDAAVEQRRPFFIGALDATKTINVGDTLRFPAGSISIALD